jgi:hypothetical protein
MAATSVGSDANTELYVREAPPELSDSARCVRSTTRPRRGRRASSCSDARLCLQRRGMSVDSGIPDYRGGPGSVWSQDVAREQLYGLTTAERSQAGSWFRRDASAAWGDMITEADALSSKSPHAGYAALARLCVLPAAGFFVLTSNIDELHNRSAGGGAATGRIAASAVPLCSACGKPARPNLLFFEDEWANIEAIALRNAERAAMVQWLRGSTKPGARLVVLEIGAGDAVKTVRNRAHAAHADALAAGASSLMIRIKKFQSALEASARCPPETFLALPTSAVDALCEIETRVSARRAPHPRATTPRPRRVGLNLFFTNLHTHEHVNPRSPLLFNALSPLCAVAAQMAKGVCFRRD